MVPRLKRMPVHLPRLEPLGLSGLESSVASLLQGSAHVVRYESYWLEETADLLGLGS